LRATALGTKIGSIGDGGIAKAALARQQRGAASLADVALRQNGGAAMRTKRCREGFSALGAVRRFRRIDGTAGPARGVGLAGVTARDSVGRLRRGIGSLDSRA
jgi:hypothetical protein